MITLLLSFHTDHHGAYALKIGYKWFVEEKDESQSKMNGLALFLVNHDIVGDQILFRNPPLLFKA